jgi:hypothetical protein
VRIKEKDKARLLEVKIVERVWKCSACGAVTPQKNHGNRKGIKPIRCWNRETCGRLFYERTD